MLRKVIPDCGQNGLSSRYLLLPLSVPNMKQSLIGAFLSEQASFAGHCAIRSPVSKRLTFENHCYEQAN
jgi:hypothetical protein